MVLLGKCFKLLFCICTQGSGEQARALPTGQTEDLECGLLIGSIGYKSLPVEPAVPFNAHTSTVPNEMGRVSHTAGKRKGIVRIGSRQLKRFTVKD